MKYRKINSYMFNLSLGVFFILLFFSFFAGEELSPILKDKELIEYSNNWKLSYGRNEENINLPLNYKDFQENQIVLEKVLPKINFYNNYLFFRSFQSNLDIYIGDEKVYEYKPKTSFFKRIPGSTWVLVELHENYSGKTIKIEKESKYSKYHGRVSEIYLGTKAQIITSLLKASIGGIITSFFMLILGLVSILISLFTKRAVNNKKILYLGMFSIFCSFWSMGELRIIQLFFGNITFVSHLAFLSLSMGIISFLMFVSTFEFYAKDLILKRIVLISILNFFVINICHAIGIKDLFQSLFLTHFCILISVLYISGKFLYFYYKKNVDSDVKNLHINMLLFFIIALTDLVKFYTSGIIRLGGGIRVGLSYFITVMTIISIKQISKAFSENLEINLLRKIAYTDSLTRLNNRSALDKRVDEISHLVTKEEFLLIAVDMNNLKVINDNHGHHAGDRAIILVGRLLAEKFKKTGDVYRLGGDEFLIIANKSITNEIGVIFENLNEDIRRGFDFSKVKPYLAYGYMPFREKDNFEDILREADSKMYLCKEKMKNREKLDYIFN